MVVFLVLMLWAALVTPSAGVKNASYLITMAPNMEVGRPQKICMILYQYRRLDVYYTLNVTKKYFSEKHKYRRGQGGCITFTIPENLASQTHRLDVDMVGENGLRLHDTVTFTPSARQETTFIHSDKPVYKPGQLVRFRIMKIDTELIPIKDKISLIRIMTPSDVIMKQWRNVDNKNGLITLDYQLSPDPPQGFWVILANTDGRETRAKFEVKEYVLPKFSVTISPPTRITEKTDTIEGEVCVAYSYGQPVKGKLMVESCIREVYQTYDNGKKPCTVIHAEVTGCFTYSFAAAILRPYYERRYGYLKLVTHVAFLEEVTGVIVNQTKDGPKITKLNVNIDIKSHTRKFFKPLLPYEVKALVTYDDGKPIQDQMVTITCEEIGFEKKMATDQKGFVSYFFNRVGTEKPKIHFHISADGIDKPAVVFEPIQWFSPSDSYLEVQPMSETIGPGLQPIVVYMTKPFSTPFRATVQVSSRGRIIYHTQHRYKVRKNKDGTFRKSPPWCRNLKRCGTDRKYSPDVPSFNVYVNVTCAMAPEATLLVYYITEAGEVVADAEYFKVEQCFLNPVKMAFTPPKEYPGYPVQMTLSGAPGSVCGVSVVDKSVFTLGGKNQISPQQIFSILDRFNANPDRQYNSYSSNEEYCKKWLERTGLSNSDEIEVPRYPYYYISNTYRYESDYVDSLMAFQLAHLRTEGNLDLNSRPCRKKHSFRYYRGRRSLDSALREWQSDSPNDASGDAQIDDEDESQAADPKKKTVASRSYFPETWLWDIEIIGDSGTTVLNKTLPGAITEWVGSTVCAESSVGIGVSESASVTTFQPFFVSFTLPYAAIRGEHIPITISVFNYLTECIEIELRLNDSTEFELVNPERVTWMCICGNEAKRHDFVIIPKSLGFINISANAKSVKGDSQCPNVKPNDEYVGIRDAVVRQLLVEPEGDEKEYTYSTMACAGTDNFFDSIDLPLFENQVPDSGRGVIKVQGDLMGPSFSNIGSLLRVPYGCGEQNMINFAPNVFIMTYLKAVKKLTPEIEATIEKYLGSGYQRELNYMRTDGSFSAFGNNDNSGSTWLTAFVLKSFYEAQPFLEIDENVLRNARYWLKSKQQSNGCFREVGRVIHSSMRGGVDGANSEVTLTSYVMGALLVAGTPKEDPAILHAINCIVAEPIKDVYTMAGAAYATALHDPNSRGHVNIQRQLHSKTIVNGSLMHWETKEDSARSKSYYYRASALNVETTAYALLAYMQENDLESALKIVKWLQKQRNPNGGFASTQDTVVALHALSVFAREAVGDKLKMSLAVQGTDFQKNFVVTADNSMVLQTAQLRVPNEISVHGLGSGCLLFQATVRYNTYSLDKEDLAFTLNASVLPPKEEKPVCSTRTISVCTSYVKGGSSGMAIVNAKMVTGWVIDQESLEKLKDDSLLGLKRYELDSKRPDNVHFYFDELTEHQRCLSFDVNQEIKVENTKEAIIQVYDYYDTELVTKMFYTIDTDCKSSVSAQKVEKPDRGETGLGKAVDKDVIDAETIVVKESEKSTDIDEGEPEDGSGVLDKVDPTFLADGLTPLPNSIPVVNMFIKAEETDFAKGEEEGKKEQTISVRSGSTAYLQCPLEAKHFALLDQSFTLAWIDDSQQAILHAGRTLIDDVRVKSYQRFHLAINNVTHEDVGQYHCMINTNPVIRGNISLSVQESPQFVHVSPDTTASIGDTVYLHCNGSGDPEPKVTWYRILQKNNVRKRVGKGSEMTIKSIQNSAVFECVVDNNIPPSVSRRIIVTVDIPPIILPKSISRVGGQINGTALLECLVKASPPLYPTWKKRGRKVSGDRYDFDTILVGSSTYSVELRINNIVQRDFDDYTCEITNDDGVVSGKITLYDNTPTIARPTSTREPPPTTPFTGGCPICQRLSEKQATFAFCEAKAAYRVLGIRIRSTRIKVKILVDFRPIQRVKIRRVLRLILDKDCSCDIITKLKSREMLGLFMNRKVDFSTRPREIFLGDETTAILMPKSLERKIILGRKTCQPKK